MAQTLEEILGEKHPLTMTLDEIAPRESEEEESGFLPAIARRATGLLKMPQEIYRAATEPPETKAETWIAAQPGGTGAILAKRLIIDPAIRTMQIGIEAVRQGDIAKAAITLPASVIPFEGPAIPEIYERSKRGDVTGAIGESLFDIATLAPGLPKVRAVAKTGLSRLRPKTSISKPSIAPKNAEAIPKEEARQSSIEISEKLATDILDDVKTIRETGTIDEFLKPEARAEAREIFGDKSRLISLETVNRTQQQVSQIGEEIARLRKVSEVEGSPGQNRALQAAEETGKLLAERLLAERRQWGLIGQKYQTPVQGISEAALAELEKLGVNLRKITKPGFSDMVYEYWINSILSGPLTHIVNTTSNTLVRLTTPVEKGLAGGVDFLRAKLTGTPQEILMGEAAADIYGATAGLREGMRSALKAFTTEQPIFGKTKLEAMRPKVIPGRLGRVVRLPGRLLTAADEFYKEINFSAEKHSLAYRQAATEGVTGWQRIERIADILKEPSKKLLEQGERETVYRVFQQDFGPIGSKLSSLRATTPGLRYVIPFLRTPLNISKFALERTPLNTIRILDKVRKGELKGGAISSELAKPVLGSLIGAGVMQFVSDGFITGAGPKDEGSRRVLYESGWQPYSARIGNRYYSFSRLEPIGSLFGMAADLKEGWDELDKGERQEVIYKIIESVSKNIASKTYLTGIVDSVEAFSDPDRYGERWIQRFAGSFVPTGIAQVARAKDPFFRKPGNLEETLRSRIPGMSEGVPPRLGVFGEPSKRGGGFIEQLTSPLYVSEIKPLESVERELARLGIGIGELGKKLSIRKKDVELSEEQFGQLSRESGARARFNLGRLFSSSRYNRMGEEDKKEAVRRIFQGARDIARNKLRRQIQKGE